MRHAPIQNRADDFLRRRMEQLAAEKPAPLSAVEEYAGIYALTDHRWRSTTEIADRYGASARWVTQALDRMARAGDLEWRPGKPGSAKEWRRPATESAQDGQVGVSGIGTTRQQGSRSAAKKRG